MVEPSPSPAAVSVENPARVLWALAWPAVALNSMQVVNTLLDRAFIGHLPLPALTAHGAATNVMFLMFSLAAALATGATALVSRAFGAGEPDQFRAACRQSMALAIFGGFAIALLTAAVSQFAARSLIPVADREAQRLMTQFVVLYALGLPAIYVIQTLAGALRGIGDTKSPMVISGFQILLHIVLNFVLIHPSRPVEFLGANFTLPGAGLGLAGAAIALASSAWAAAIVYLGYSGRTPLGRQWDLRLPDLGWARRILKVAVPAAVGAVLRVLSLTAFTLVLKSVPDGSVAIAAMSIGFAIESIMFMPAFGLSMAAGALVGQSLGMKDPARAERLGWVATWHASYVTLALAGPIFLFAPQIATALVGDKPLLISETVTLLRLLCLTEVLFAVAMVLVGALQGAGDTARTAWISVICLWGVRVPLAYILALPVGMGATGAWISMSLTQALQGLLCIVIYRQGKWKTKEV